MLNKFESVKLKLTSSPNNSLDSSMKQNVGQLSLFSADHRNVIRKRQVLSNMEPSESRKMTIFENLQKSWEFPPGILRTVDSRKFPGIPERELPVALVCV